MTKTGMKHHTIARVTVTMKHGTKKIFIVSSVFQNNPNEGVQDDKNHQRISKDS